MKLRGALLIIDVQMDFLPGGALAVKGGDEIIPLINELQKQFSRVFATKDWHPPGHISFATTHKQSPFQAIELKEGAQDLWPDHCVQETLGSEFPKNLNTEKIERVFYKGSDLSIDSYSAFYDNAKKRSTGLGEFLQKEGINEITLVGLTTEYCIKFSALDAVALGFKTTVLTDAIRSVDIHKGDGKRALEEMQRAGVLVMAAVP